MTVTDRRPLADAAVPRHRLRRWSRRTEGRLGMVTAVLVALGILAGVSRDLLRQGDQRLA